MRVIVTGGAGFIGGAVVRQFIGLTDATVVNVDKLTYASSLDGVAEVEGNPRYHFEQIDVCDPEAVRSVFARYRPDAVMHLAAESHVDRSIDGPAAFIETNVRGTFVMLEEALAYWNALEPGPRERFRFHHVSTDEVYGSLGPTGLFTEASPYRPNSPYSASKAAADHLVRAWFATYGLPVVITNCSNNFGPFQHPEKLVPLVITKALAGQPLPIYGKGDNVRDWLYVEDHAEALRLVLARGRIGETYNIGGGSERTNLQVVNAICAQLDDIVPDSPHRPHAKLIAFVADRPGHDKRYAIDASKVARDLGWKPGHNFDQAMQKTVTWFVENRAWAEKEMARTGAGERLGLGHGHAAPSRA
ncbi:MAG: dTDP-glucose 4,6-dehydratase [Alphaproteobacteria bacterium]